MAGPGLLIASTSLKGEVQVIMIGVDPTIWKNLKNTGRSRLLVTKAFVRIHLQSCNERLIGEVQSRIAKHVRLDL